MAGASSDWPQLYNMTNERRGLVCLFNQERFTAKGSSGKTLKLRSGTNEDKINLTKRFENLDFTVRAFDNLNKASMLNKLKEAAKEDHKDADCFVCIILSHGEQNHIFASDKKVEMKEITELFRGNNCGSLVGKPKIFIIQACAGEKEEEAVTGMAVGFHQKEPSPFYSLPAGADFLMCYSTTEGFVSYRHMESGALYIQDLCKALEEHGSTLEFTELLTLVNLMVAERDPKLKKKQMPCFTSMLTKKLYFKPKK